MTNAIHIACSVQTQREVFILTEGANPNVRCYRSLNREKHQNFQSKEDRVRHALQAFTSNGEVVTMKESNYASA